MPGVYGLYTDSVLSSPPTDTKISPSPIFFAIVGISLASGWLLTADLPYARVSFFVFVMSTWVLSVIFHEFAHAIMAWFSGDTSIAERGYLRLDPRTYTHPILSFGLPLLFIALGGIGLPGGAVLINRNALSSFQSVIVAIAGPLTNLIFGSLCLLVVSTGMVGESSATTSADLPTALSFFGFLQIAVFVLNMLPVPGLDGYAAIEPALPAGFRDLMVPVSRYGTMILILFIFYFAPVRNLFFEAVFQLVEIYGVPSTVWRAGFDVLPSIR